MRNQILNLTNHSINNDQIAELKTHLGTGEVVNLTPEMKGIWSRINPRYDEGGLLNDLKPIIDLVSQGWKAVIIAGDFSAVLSIVFACPQENFIFATSERQTIETVAEDGTVTKRSVFKHIRFRSLDDIRSTLIYS